MYGWTNFTSDTSLYSCYNKKDEKYFKVNVENRQNKIEILKNGKKLKGRKVENQVDIYLSYDTTFSVREAKNNYLT